jgi:ribonuclease HI
MLLGDGQVAEGEMEGLVRGTERALANGADHVLMVSDSQAAYKVITSTRARGSFMPSSLTCSFALPCLGTRR